MAEMTWEKPKHQEKPKRGLPTERAKFLLGGGLILAAVAFLLISGTMQGARFFITVDEVVSDSSYINQTVRISGAVIGESIEYDSENATIYFTIANIPSQYDDLATALHEATLDTTATRLDVVVENEPMPDLLQNEAQAILTGAIQADGTFLASELLLKCPSRFEESSPNGISSMPGKS